MEEIWLPYCHPCLGEQDEYPMISSHGWYQNTHDTEKIYGFLQAGRYKINVRGRHIPKARILCWTFYPRARMMDDQNILWHADHINEKKTEDVLWNLQVLQPAEHARKGNSIPNRKRNGIKRGKPVEKLTLDGIIVDVFPTICDAAKSVPLGSRRHIQSVCCKKRETHANFRWRFQKQTIEGEIWTVCEKPEFSGTEWSNLGRIKSVFGVIGYGSKMACGYKRVRIHQRGYLVHRIIALEGLKAEYEAKKGAMRQRGDTDDIQVDHIDRNRENNRIDNLRWVTRTENMQNLA